MTLVLSVNSNQTLYFSFFCLKVNVEAITGCFRDDVLDLEKSMSVLHLSLRTRVRAEAFTCLASLD